ncbi:MAG TPA: glycosyltransferase family 1 protein [Mesorhizobium sp.]|nr:glycosyltransferase family 1 protein [Mesorhizobium sp.]
MKLALVTDAWAPQVNGVVNTLSRLVERLRERGDEVTVIAPNRFRTLPCPTYPEIRLALARPGEIGRLLDRSGADFFHIATEGPLGFWARRHLLRSGRFYTTSYHTKFPEYLAARAPVPLSVSYAWMRRFHNAGLGCMVATPSLMTDLERHGFRNLRLWPRGVDAELFRPRPGADLGLKRPVFLSVGRVAVEKNLTAFLALDLPGTKLVVGDGPARAELEKRFPEAVFLGLRRGEALAAAYASADVFVFPSLTDTFGNVMLEALASGVPVAAFPVTGPQDVIGDSGAGVLDHDLRRAVLQALEISREAARAHALRYSWETSVRIFRDHVLEANGEKVSEAA